MVKLRKILKPIDIILKTCMFPWYFSGKGPFKNFEDNQYTIGLFLNKPYIAQKPGVGWDLEKILPFGMFRWDKNKIHKAPRDIDFEFSFVTPEGLNGKYTDCQFTYEIPTSKDAKKFLWVGERDMGKIKQQVISSLNLELAKKKEGEKKEGEKKEGEKKEGEKKEGEKEEETNYNPLQNIEDIYKKAIEKVNNNDTIKLYGIKIRGISLGKPEWSQEAQEIISTTYKAAQEAQAKIIESKAEKIEQENYAEASTGIYTTTYQSIKNQTKKVGLNLTPEEIDERTREQMKMLNYQQIAQENGNLFLNPSSESYNSKLSRLYQIVVAMGKKLLNPPPKTLEGKLT